MNLRNALLGLSLFLSTFSQAARFASHDGEALWKSSDYGNVRYIPCYLEVRGDWSSASVHLEVLKVHCEGVDHQSYTFDQKLENYSFEISAQGEVTYRGNPVGKFQDKRFEVTLKNDYEERVYIELKLLSDSKLSVVLSVDSFDYPSFDFWSNRPLELISN